MHKYELSYDHMNVPQTKSGESHERLDAHQLLQEALGLGKDGQIIGTASARESLALMRFTNVRVTWS